MPRPSPTPLNTLVAIPTMGWLRAELVAWVIENKFEFITSIGVSPHSAARNYLFGQFLMDEYDYLLMIDSDTVPLPGTFEYLSYLVDAGADVATGITPIIKGHKLCVNVYRDHESVEKCVCRCEVPSGPFEVVGCGMSYILMSKHIIEKVNELTKGHPCRAMEFSDGKRCSEDLYFSDRVREVGGKIVCHPEAEAVHVKEMPIMFECGR